eukprot:12936346-Prorocentrum_lima.AAC.1
MGITWDQAGPLQWEHLLVVCFGRNMKKGSTAPPFEAKSMDPCVKGHVSVTTGKWHQSDGTKWHG